MKKTKNSDIDPKSASGKQLVARVQAKLRDFLGKDYTDESLSQYVVVMLAHQTPQQTLASNLEEFLGDVESKDMGSWVFEQLLPEYEKQQAQAVAQPAEAPATAGPPAAPKGTEGAAKGAAAGSTADPGDGAKQGGPVVKQGAAAPVQPPKQQQEERQKRTQQQRPKESERRAREPERRRSRSKGRGRSYSGHRQRGRSRDRSSSSSGCYSRSSYTSSSYSRSRSRSRGSMGRRRHSRSPPAPRRTRELPSNGHQHHYGTARMYSRRHPSPRRPQNHYSPPPRNHFHQHPPEYPDHHSRPPPPYDDYHYRTRRRLSPPVYPRQRLPDDRERRRHEDERYGRHHDRAGGRREPTQQQQQQQQQVAVAPRPRGRGQLQYQSERADQRAAPASGSPAGATAAGEEVGQPRGQRLPGRTERYARPETSRPDRKGSRQHMVADELLSGSSRRHAGRGEGVWTRLVTSNGDRAAAAAAAAVEEEEDVGAAEQGFGSGAAREEEEEVDVFDGGPEELDAARGLEQPWERPSYMDLEQKGLPRSRGIVSSIVVDPSGRAAATAAAAAVPGPAVDPAEAAGAIHKRLPGRSVFSRAVLEATTTAAAGAGRLGISLAAGVPTAVAGAGRKPVLASEVQEHGQHLRAAFGGGYGSGAAVPAAGLQRQVQRLSSGLNVTVVTAGDQGQEQALQRQQQQQLFLKQQQQSQLALRHQAQREAWPTGAPSILDRLSLPAPGANAGLCANGGALSPLALLHSSSSLPLTSPRLPSTLGSPTSPSGQQQPFSPVAAQPSGDLGLPVGAGVGGGAVAGSLQADHELLRLRMRRMELELTRLRAEGSQGSKAAKDAAASAAKLSLAQRSVTVTGVHPSATEAVLSAHFRFCGGVARVTLLKDPVTGESSGMAWVQFATPEGAQRALDLSGSSLLQRTITVVPKESPAAKAATSRLLKRSQSYPPPQPAAIIPMPVPLVPAGPYMPPKRRRVGGRGKMSHAQGIFQGMKSLEFWVKVDQGMPDVAVNIGSAQARVIKLVLGFTSGCSPIKLAALAKYDWRSGWAKYQAPLSQFSSTNTPFNGCGGMGTWDLTHMEFKSQGHPQNICLSSIQLFP
ncbi:hypothetical protein N2152v2_003270 [Parachlorella kessleri]